MEEFIFGNVAIDDLKLIHHRTSLSGIHHSHELTPRSADELSSQHREEISMEIAPEFLALRLERYRNEYGLDVVLMCKP